jgi:hypothetical protein
MSFLFKYFIAHYREYPKKLLLILVILIMQISCSSEKVTKDMLTQKYNDELKHDLQIIQNHRIYFGHMSIGENIIEGLQDILKKYPDIHLNIINLHQTQALPDYYFAHSYVGDNYNPQSKCHDFIQTINSKLTPGLEYAFLKFCFVDIDRNSNVKAILELYKTTIDSLRVKHPEIKIVHLTVPLISQKVSWYLKLKRLVKKVIGRKDYFPMDNIKRNEYNELLQNYFKDEPIFDIARFESTYLDGRRELYNYHGIEYPALIFEYTDDAGHLNMIGRQIIAIELVKLLAKLSSVY